MGTMSATPVWESALSAGGRPVGVDRDNKIIRGYIVAELGPFKTPGRGEFDLEALREIVRLGNASKMGLKSRFTHPGLSTDGLGSMLGRARSYAMDGENKVRADLHLSESSFNTPQGNLGQYVMDLADEDSTSLGSSLVLQSKKTYRKDEKGNLLKGPAGEELPPLWFPMKLMASDLVDEGDATNSLLSVEDLDDLPDAGVRMAWEAMNRVFGGQDRLTTEARARAFLDRYLNHRFGAVPSLSVDAAKKRLAEFA